LESTALAEENLRRSGRHITILYLRLMSADYMTDE